MCEAKFSNKFDLLAHEKTHADARPYKCEMLRDFQNCRVTEVSQVDSCGKPAEHLQVLQKVLQKQKPAGPSRESSCWGEAFQVHPLRSVLRDGQQAYKAHNCNSYELATGNSADYLETRNKIV